MEEPASRPGVTYSITLEYDGTAFAGWQRQPGQRTVEGVVCGALRDATGEEPRLTAAGRTDSGAHSCGQVVGCTLRRPWRVNALRAALNAMLPADVAVTGVVEAAPGFHARFDAVSRSYRYLVSARQRSPLIRRRAWEVRGELDLDAMRRAATFLVGRHDFAAFGASPRPGGSTVRNVSRIDVRKIGITPASELLDGVVIEVEADAFLYGMMRTFSAALVRVGQGKLPVSEVARMVASPAGRYPHVAPAHGLYQWKVAYDDRQGTSGTEKI